MDLEHKRCSMEVKSLDQSGTFAGLLSVYDVIDEYRDVVERGAFTKSLQENGGQVPLLWQHNQDQPIGVLQLRDGTDGLEAKGTLLLADEVPQARTAYALLKAGVVRGLSIGFKPIKKKMEENIRRLKEIKLYEGSLVTIPANRFALVESVKSLSPETKDFNAELQAIELWARQYQMIQALSRALDRVIYDDSGKDEKVSAIEEIIRQFSDSYTAFAPQLFDMIGLKSPQFEAPSVIPQEIRQHIADLGNNLITLSEKHSGTPTRAAGAAPDVKVTEPDQIHSLLTASLDRWDAILTR